MAWICCAFASKFRLQLCLGFQPLARRRFPAPASISCNAVVKSGSMNASGSFGLRKLRPFSVRSASWLFSSMAKKQFLLLARKARFLAGRRAAPVRPGSSAADFPGSPASCIKPSDVGWPILTRYSSRPISRSSSLGVLRHSSRLSGCSFLISSSASDRNRLQSCSCARTSDSTGGLNCAVLLVDA